MTRIFKHMVGDIEVTALTDGDGQFTDDQFPGTDAAEISQLMKAAGQDAIVTNFNAFLIRSGNDLTLVDAGPRELFGPTAGFLPDALTEAGVDPSDVTRLFFSHLHPDHIAGALTPSGEVVFKNAEVIVDEAELALWMDAGNFSGAGEQAQQFQALAEMVIKAYGDRVSTVTGVSEIAAGVTSLPLPGHTVGHCGIRVNSGAEQFVMAADIIHAQDLQLANPDIGIVFDMDGAEAAKSRKSMLDMLATDGTAFSGGHIHFPAIGTVKRAGGGYRFQVVS